MSAYALAERGYDVAVVDPDVGPSTDGTWRRRGVMQFMHPHFFRPQVRHALEAHAPAMWDAIVAAGGVVNTPPPGMPPHMTTLACRRITFERAMRDVAAAHPRITLVTANAQDLLVDGDSVRGVRAAGGDELAADVVLVASGRTGKLGDAYRPDAEGGPCGQSYVARMYRARPGVEPLVSAFPLGAQYDGYLTIAFPQDAGTLSALIVRASADTALSLLWQQSCYEAAVAMIPNLAPWTDQERFEPITDVMRGGTLTNSYRGQGSPPTGLYFVGDAVCTTNPSAGRGVSLGLMQAGALLGAIAEHGNTTDASAAFDAWCLENVRPWYDDHVVWDAAIVRRYAGEEIDIEAPLSSDVICDAAVADPSLMAVVGPYQGMVVLPSALLPLEGRVRELLRGGWRPSYSDGPTRDQLVDVIQPVAVA
jgi:2-polyprenyl-6-methoxyphenol hydroxylase-like FAD-dependent oxidoreductase